MQGATEVAKQGSPSHELPCAPDVEACLLDLQRIVQQDEGGRGIAPLVHAAHPKSLIHAARVLLDSPNCVIISGFPCIQLTDSGSTDANSKNSFKTHSAAQETDGPPGVAILAFALSQLGVRVRFVVESVNAPPFHASLAVYLGKQTLASADHVPAYGSTCTIMSEYANGMVVVEEFPSVDWAAEHEAHLRVIYDELVECKGSLLAIERAGPGSDGMCRTMRGRPLESHIVAPLHLLFQWANTDSALVSNASSGVTVPAAGTLSTAQGVPTTVCIGDGGNELGMGHRDVVKSIIENIPQGDSIACVVPADVVLVSSVSNWGAYALAAGMCVLASTQNESTEKKEITSVIGDVKQAHAAVVACVEEGGASDGVTQRRESTVDGMPLEQSLQVFEKLYKVVADRDI